MTDRENIFTQSIDHLQNQHDKIKDLVASLSDVDWLNTLDAKKINEIVVRLICVCDEDTVMQFISIVQKTNIKLESFSDSQWLTVFKNANSFWMKRMISGYKHLTTGPAPRDPESKEEEILYCLSTSIRGMEKMPSEIVTSLLAIVNLNVETPDYKQDALSIVCESSNIDYIRIILQRATNEKNRKELLEYIQDRRWIWNRDESTVKFIEELENAFQTFDLPFSEVVYGRYFKNNDILSMCNKAQILEICIKYLPTRNRNYILQGRSFSILCNLLIGELDELRKTVEILEREGVVLSPLFEKRCKEKGMCLLDKVCLEGNQAAKVSYILSKMTEYAKRKALITKNYGFRTPLLHAKYYAYNNTEREDVIIAEMKSLGL